MRHVRSVLPWTVLAVCIALPCPARAADDDASQQLMPIMRVMPAIEHAGAGGTIGREALAAPVADTTGERSVPHVYSNAREVKAPLDVAACEGVRAGRDQAVVLYISGNRGRTWVRTQKRTLPSSGLEFRAVNDGQYWAVFKGEPVASRGPAPLPGAQPDLVITVDTMSPEIKSLVASPARENEPVRVTWQVADRGPLGGVKIAAAQGESKETIDPQDVAPSLEGSALVGPLSAGTWDFTVTFRDMAGNMTTACCRTTVAAVPAAEVAAETVQTPTPAQTPAATESETVAPAPDAGPTSEPAAPMPAAAPSEPEPQPPAPQPQTSDAQPTEPAAAPADVVDVQPAAQQSPTPSGLTTDESAQVKGDQWVEPGGEVRANRETPVLQSRLLSIGYTWDKESPPSRVGLWVTTDGGRTWQLDHVARRLTGTFVFQAPADGVYGFQTHREIGESTWGVPLGGEAPQVEIIVDTEPPHVEWTSPLGAETADGPGRAPAKVGRTMVLAWLANDANLGEKPVRLDYRPFGKTLWQPIAAEIANSGSYEWTAPESLHGQVEVQVTVLDRAGHLASAELPLEIVPAQPAAAEPQTSASATEQATEDSLSQSQRAYAMATLARLQENWTDAEYQLKRATTLNPDHTRAWVDLGGIYASNKRWDPAVDAYRKATSLQPQNTNALLGLARSLAARGDVAGATQTVETLLRLSPTDGDALVLYGDLLWKSGKNDMARQAWLKALDSGGGHQGRLAAIQKRLQLKP
ncbi:MAG: tetratricopeptide repeat protein [Planctomycetes bacterium]|nr:tetratricopeptide repeat protein [Planctomycetota bacterium]